MLLIQNWETALFQNLDSNPATMEAGKMADFYGCLPDHDCQQADAEQACVQAELRMKLVWPSLLRPVPLFGRLNGKTLLCALSVLFAGTQTAAHSGGNIVMLSCDRQGVSPLFSGRRAICVNLQLLLAVYVRDFKLSGPITRL
jgi:hypothetical protein